MLVQLLVEYLRQFSSVSGRDNGSSRTWRGLVCIPVRALEYQTNKKSVLDDGGEVDLDLGNYERYLNVTLVFLLQCN